MYEVEEIQVYYLLISHYCEEHSSSKYKELTKYNVVTYIFTD